MNALLDEVKTCSKCKVTRTVGLFRRKSKSKDGLNGVCKICQGEYEAKWIRNNPERSKAIKQRWQSANAEIKREKEAKKRQSDPDKYRQRVREWRAANSERQKENSRRASKVRRSDPHKRVSSAIGLGVWKAIRKGKALRKWSELLGYSEKELIAHLERQFSAGMTWENYGKWHIDHILPVSSFNIQGPDCPELKRAWSLPNLRPLWANDNLKKNARVETLL